MLYRLVISSIQKQEKQINLTSEQQHYLNRVLRLGEGDRFVAMDGEGKAWIAKLMGKSATIVEPLVESTELPITVTLMVALPKGNGFDEVVRCCAELGVTTFIPLMSDRTLLNPSANKLVRWRRIAMEAAEQSERQIVPTVLEPISFIEALNSLDDHESDGYICVTRREANHLLTCLHHQPGKNLVIATGCEGGWTNQEVESAIAAGFKPVSLGSRILRAITAPMVVMSLVAAMTESSDR